MVRQIAENNDGEGSENGEIGIYGQSDGMETEMQIEDVQGETLDFVQECNKFETNFVRIKNKQIAKLGSFKKKLDEYR